MWRSYCTKSHSHRFDTSNVRRTLFGCLVVLISCLATHPGFAGPLVLDSFVDGDFSISTTTSGGTNSQQVGTMVGTERLVHVSTQRHSLTVVAEKLSTTEQIDFEYFFPVDPVAATSGSVHITYGHPAREYPYTPKPLHLDLSSYDAFEFDILALRGAAALSVVFGTGYSSDYQQFPIPGPGTFRFPFANVVGSNFADIHTLTFWFFGLTTDTALSVGEIRAVPEPTTSALANLLCLIPFLARSNR
jgi:hypothetical protein